MRKIFVFFTIAFLAVGIVACSSDDNTVDSTTDKELYLKIDQSVIHEDETVSFTAFDDKNKQVEAEFYVDGLKVTNKYQFTKKGIYVVIAKKKGYKDTTPLTVEVVKAGEVIIKTLVLKANKYDIVIGETVSFSTTDGVNEVQDAGIMHIADNFIPGEVEWTPTRLGTFKFKAVKQGYFESNIITINVKQKPVKEKTTFTIDNIQYNADLIGLAVKGNMETFRPILFEENGQYYFIYTMYYMEEDGKNSITYSMKVFVPKGTNRLVLPYEVDQSQIKPLDILTYFASTAYKLFKADEIVVDKMDWTKPIAGESPGKIRTQIRTSNKENSIDYEGFFDELILDEYQERNKIKGEKRLSTTKVDIQSVNIEKKKIQ